METKEAIKKYESKEITLEEFFETIIKQGNCPALVNDDNGHWGVSETGVQNVVFGDEPSDLQTSFFIEAEDFKKTIREAVIHFYKDSE